eukprot:6205566-Pleurochrysis_carterae.AAC.1
MTTASARARGSMRVRGTRAASLTLRAPRGRVASACGHMGGEEMTLREAVGAQPRQGAWSGAGEGCTRLANVAATWCSSRAHNRVRPFELEIRVLAVVCVDAERVPRELTRWRKRACGRGRRVDWCLDQPKAWWLLAHTSACDVARGARLESARARLRQFAQGIRWNGALMGGLMASAACPRTSGCVAPT